ncbi:hypothetical protein BGZ83_007527, partial [Gryganskiella cystojenkinii]
MKCFQVDCKELSTPCRMQDAVILTNCLYDLKSLKQGDIEEALQDYGEQRQTIMERAVRYVILNWFPQFMKNKALIKDAVY